MPRPPQIAGWRAAGRRCGAAAVTLACSVGLCFALGQWTPGDAFSQLELDPGIGPAALASLRARYLPQASLPHRLLAWLGAAARGDLGYSLQFHRPVLRILRERAPASFKLMICGLALAWGLGLAAALVPAWLGESGRRRWERAAGAVAELGAAGLAALPIGLLAILALLAAPVGWLPRAGDGTGMPWLAGGVLGLAFFPAVYFQSAQALAAVRRLGFLRQGRAAGLSPWRLLWRHAVPNTADVLIPLASLTVSQALVELVVVESLLGWPGLGQLSLQAAMGRDMPLLAALVLATSLLVVASNTASDLAQVGLNPRLRAAEGQPPTGRPQ